VVVVWQYPETAELFEWENIFVRIISIVESCPTRKSRAKNVSCEKDVARGPQSRSPNTALLILFIYYKIVHRVQHKHIIKKFKANTEKTEKDNLKRKIKLQSQQTSCTGAGLNPGPLPIGQ